ncbi:PREDICTED: uncharacterized protein LOC109587620, partial [Amphimedon queenslandica]|uniref:Uncharacterized protein n=2 Tax=Amphimedon queenslandica TaxID=400682 RepID=A0AAN0JQV7_AMPQE
SEIVVSANINLVTPAIYSERASLERASLDSACLAVGVTIFDAKVISQFMFSSEGNIPTTSATTLRAEDVSVGKEVESSRLGRESIRSIKSHTKSEEAICLIEAIKKDNIGIVEVQLKQGADPNIADTYDNTPLHCASEAGNANIIKLLITKGKADVNAVNKVKLLTK